MIELSIEEVVKLQEYLEALPHALPCASEFSPLCDCARGRAIHAVENLEAQIEA